MKNVEMTVDQKSGILTIKVDLKQPGIPSSSGKSLVIGSSQGNQSVVHGSEIIKVGVNVYAKAKADMAAAKTKVADAVAPAMAQGASVAPSRK